MMEFIFTIFTAFITSSVTVNFALSKFRDEKIWKKSLDNYTNLLEALYSTKEFLEKRLDEPESKLKQYEVSRHIWLQQYKDHKDTINKFRNIGSLTASVEAMNVINTYYSNLSTDEVCDTSERYDIDIKATQLCIDQLIIKAKAHLKIKKSFGLF